MSWCFHAMRLKNPQIRQGFSPMRRWLGWRPIPLDVGSPTDYEMRPAACALSDTIMIVADSESCRRIPSDAITVIILISISSSSPTPPHPYPALPRPPLPPPPPSESSFHYFITYSITSSFHHSIHSVSSITHSILPSFYLIPNLLHLSMMHFNAISYPPFNFGKWGG